MSTPPVPHLRKARDEINTALFTAIEKQDTSDLHKVLQLAEGLKAVAGPQEFTGYSEGVGVMARDTLDRTPLMCAAMRGKSDHVNSLLGYNAPVDAQDGNGNTALHWAAKNGHAEVMIDLIENDADPYILNRKNKTAGDLSQGEARKVLGPRPGPPIDADVEAFRQDFRTRVEQHKERFGRLLKPDEALMDAVNQHAPVNQVTALLLEGASPNARDSQCENLTVLMRAAANGHAEIAKILLDAGAQTEEKCSDGYDNTALMLAAGKGHSETVKVLALGGADLEATDNQGNTTLIKAAQRGRVETCEVLLDLGAKVDARGHGRNTALLCADSPELLTLLLDRGAAVDAKDSYRQTALIKHAGVGSEDTVQILLDRGAAIDAIDTQNDTALHRAASRGKTSTALLLLDAGADATLVNKRGKTAEEVAQDKTKSVLIAYREREQLRQVSGVDENSQEPERKSHRM